MSHSATERRGRPLVWWGAGLMVLALVGGVVAVVGIVSQVGGALRDTFGADPFRTPATVELQLEEGPYLVYELTGSSRSAGPFDIERGNQLTVSPGDVRVTSADGVQVPVGPASYNETITQGAQTYTSAARFDIVQDGWYRVDVDAPGTQVFVAPSLVDGFRGSLVWFAVGGVSGLLLLVGLVLLIVGLVRGRRPAAAGQPAGWYADPQQAAAWRWWDGSRWTDRTG